MSIAVLVALLIAGIFLLKELAEEIARLALPLGRWWQRFGLELAVMLPAIWLVVMLATAEGAPGAALGAGPVMAGFALGMLAEWRLAPPMRRWLQSRFGRDDE